MENRRQGKISAVMILVIVNSLIFILGETESPASRVLDTYVPILSKADLFHGHVWELVTYQFRHANIFHLLFNMMALWFAGRTIEDVLGIPRFLALYFASGIVGGLVQMMTSPPWSQALGASASVCGVLGGFSAMFPDLMVTALIFFVLPIQMRAKWIGVGIIVLSLIFALIGWPPQIGHSAHLGGAVTGVVMVWLFGYGQPPFRRRGAPHSEPIDLEPL
jgi:membrane associated rhomboid family serine protease